MRKKNYNESQHSETQKSFFDEKNSQEDIKLAWHKISSHPYTHGTISIDLNTLKASSWKRFLSQDVSKFQLNHISSDKLDLPIGWEIKGKSSRHRNGRLE
jgi:hypothetical protein